MTDLIPYGRHEITDADVQAVAAALREGPIAQGHRVALFERALLDFIDAPHFHAVACSSGSAALELAVRAQWGAADGDNAVMVSPLTFVATANAVARAGFKPKFGALRDSGHLKEWGRCRRTLAVDYAGLAYRGCEEDRERPASSATIIDAAHSLGAFVEGGVQVGADGYTTCFSFHPSKLITTGEGGAVVTPDAHLAYRLRCLRDNGRDPDTGLCVLQGGTNFRMSEAAAALGLSQISRAGAYLSRRHAVAAQYDQAFHFGHGLKNATPLHTHAEDATARHIYVLRLRDGIDRAAVQVALRERGVGTQVHYRPVFLHPAFADSKVEDASGTIDFASRLLTIPLFPTMTNAEVERVIAAVREVLG